MRPNTGDKRQVTRQVIKQITKQMMIEQFMIKQMVKHDKTDNEQPINKEEIKKYKD